jgi:hypothetical protein
MGNFDLGEGMGDFFKSRVVFPMAHHVRRKSECPAQSPWVSTFANSDLGKTTLIT